MKEICPPPPVAITDGSGKPAAYGLDAFVREFVLTDKRFRDEWASSFDGLARKITLETIAVSRRTHTPIVLSDEEHDRAKSILRSVDVPTHLNATLMPFIHCWMRAKDRDDTATESRDASPAS